MPDTPNSRRGFLRKAGIFGLGGLAAATTASAVSKDDIAQGFQQARLWVGLFEDIEDAEPRRVAQERVTAEVLESTKDTFIAFGWSLTLLGKMQLPTHEAQIQRAIFQDPNIQEGMQRYGHLTAPGTDLPEEVVAIRREIENRMRAAIA